jgi:hypothetical protein
MWKTTFDLAIRTALVVSVAAFDVAPALASVGSAIDASAPPRHIGIDEVLPELAPLLLAQRVDHPSNNNDSDHNKDSRGEERGRPLSQVTTSKVVIDLASLRKECGNFDEVYRIDCLRQGLEMTAASLPDNGEYSQAKRILKKASRRLANIVNTYRDPAAPTLEIPANSNPRFKRRRQLTAIRREATPEAMARATQVIQEATTELLRSGENSERRYAHYQQISVAVDSTKVLLRSS